MSGTSSLLFSTFTLLGSTRNFCPYSPFFFSLLLFFLLFSSTMEKTVTVINNYKLWQAIKRSMGGGGGKEETGFSLFPVPSLLTCKARKLGRAKFVDCGLLMWPIWGWNIVLGLRTLFPATPSAQQLTPPLSHEKQLQYCCWVRRMWVFGVFILCVCIKCV